MAFLQSIKKLLLSNLGDTDISSATQGEVLAVDSNGKWANVDLYETGTIAIPSTFNATINRQQLYKMGRLKIVDIVLTLNQSLSGAMHFITLQANMQGENSYTDIIGTTKNGESFSCYISGTSIYFNSNLTIASGTVVCITGAYI